MIKTLWKFIWSIPQLGDNLGQVVNWMLIWTNILMFPLGILAAVCCGHIVWLLLEIVIALLITMPIKVLLLPLTNHLEK